MTRAHLKTCRRVAPGPHMIRRASERSEATAADALPPGSACTKQLPFRRIGATELVAANAALRGACRKINPLPTAVGRLSGKKKRKHGRSAFTYLSYMHGHTVHVCEVLDGSNCWRLLPAVVRAWGSADARWMDGLCVETIRG